MSKSYHNTIELFGEAAEQRKRIMRIVTDSKGLADAKDPAHCNVFALYRLFAAPAACEAMAARYCAGGLGYGEVKKALAELFEEHFAPLRRRRAELAAHPDHVEQVLRAGAERARAVACATLRKARQAVGLE